MGAEKLGRGIVGGNDEFFDFGDLQAGSFDYIGAHGAAFRLVIYKKIGAIGGPRAGNRVFVFADDATMVVDVVGEPEDAAGGTAVATVGERPLVVGRRE